MLVAALLLVYAHSAWRSCLSALSLFVLDCPAVGVPLVAGIPSSYDITYVYTRIKSSPYGVQIPDSSAPRR